MSKKYRKKKNKCCFRKQKGGRFYINPGINPYYNKSRILSKRLANGVAAAVRRQKARVVKRINREILKK